MSKQSIVDALRITIEDHRVSRGEKRALAKVIEKLRNDPQELSWARSEAFNVARESLANSDPTEIVDWLEDVIRLLSVRDDSADDVDFDAFFSPTDDCVGRITSLIGASRRSLDICVFTITDDRISDAILEAHRRNVAIRIISDNDKSLDAGSDVSRLRRQGVNVRIDESEFHMHHKYALFDRRRLLTGSYNWTRSAAMNNEENFIVTDAPKIVTRFGRQFERLWKSLQ